MTMTVIKSNGVGVAPTMIRLKTFFIHCGNYRHFEVDAENKEHAIKRFSYVKPNGFTKKNITHITIKGGK